MGHFRFVANKKPSKPFASTDFFESPLFIHKEEKSVINFNQIVAQQICFPICKFTQGVVDVCEVFHALAFARRRSVSLAYTQSILSSFLSLRDSPFQPKDQLLQRHGRANRENHILSPQSCHLATYLRRSGH